MILDISHKTVYRFNPSPQYGLQQVRLTPKERLGQSIINWALGFEGGHQEVVFTDHHNNTTHLINVDEGALELVVTASGRVEMTDQHGVVGPQIGFAPLWLYLRSTPLTAQGAGVKALAKPLLNSGGTTIEKLHDLSKAIAKAVVYQTGQTNVTSTAEEAIKTGAGVCQDHSHIFVATARFAGFPARYVSGYLMMNDRVVQDATHAWAEVYIPDLGWTGFDVSNEICPDARYVRVATGLDYSSASPISGLTFGGQKESISVDVQVQQINIQVQQ